MAAMALADGIGAITDEFPEEDLMAGINGLLMIGKIFSVWI